jgi:hypothetical protein
MYLLVLCAATTSRGTSGEPKAASERLAAAEKDAAEEKAAAKSYVKIMVEVELRGVLSCTEKAATVSIGERNVQVWVLDFGENKEMRAKAKPLDGKTVLVKGTAILHETVTVDADRRRGGFSPLGTAFLDLEPNVAVKSLVAATKK